MKAFTFRFLFPTVVAAVGLVAFRAQADSRRSNSEQEESFGARYKEGKGIELSEVTKSSINLEIAEVTEEQLSSTEAISLQVISVAPRLEAIGKLPGQVATSVSVGDEVVSSKGLGKVIELSRGSLAGDLEVLVVLEAKADHLHIGDSLSADIARKGAELVTAIPSDSLLTTVEGTFVYVVNGNHFLRTPIKTGRRGERFIEVIDGLYPGDLVVKSPVRLLWYAELQAIRGGQACTDEH